MSTPLRPRGDGCAAIDRAPGGQWGDNCTQPVAVRARWRFADQAASLLLCDHHASELEGDDRLSDVVRFYNASVEG